ncbi:MAG: chemotaxis protein CheW, partial [Spirochaetales bacterium]|nr:chemotaxis protein CheW [Spirochaetales bacterium]
VRNSLDHGIESELDRKNAGKDSQGVVTLKAERHGNSIVITVRDDGKGLDRERILSKALEKKLIRAEAADAMTDSQVFNLIFTSGFSTHTEVSLISGRGVGMDIVRSAVVDNRGRIEIESVAGSYSEFRMIFPLSTAIIDGMITRVSQSLFVFPIGSVIESIKIVPAMLSTVNGSVEVANLRGESIPVIRMHETFCITEIPESPAIIGVICETSDRRKFMFILDEVIAKREVVIKSLGARFSDLRGISSGTVLSGGKIGLVVDIDEIVDLSLMEIPAR